MKIIDIDDNSNEEDKERMIKGIIDSIKIMEICCNKNNNSVKIYEFFQSKEEIVLIMELCDNNLQRVLNKRKKGFNVKEIYNIISQLNNTFKILKEKKIAHRDIKLSNILLKYLDDQRNNFIVKLTDYDISKQITDTLLCRTHAGTSLIMAPEIIEGRDKYDNKCDLWSILCMFCL